MYRYNHTYTYITIYYNVITPHFNVHLTLYFIQYLIYPFIEMTNLKIDEFNKSNKFIDSFIDWFDFYRKLSNKQIHKFYVHQQNIEIESSNIQKQIEMLIIF